MGAIYKFSVRLSLKYFIFYWHVIKYCNCSAGFYILVSLMINFPHIDTIQVQICPPTV